MDIYNVQEQKTDKKEFSPVAPGVYKATINDVRSKEVDGTQTLSIQYKLENNRRLFQNFKFNDKGIKWLQWQLGDLGVLSKAKETKKENETPEQTCRNIHNTIVNHFVGKVFQIEVAHNEWTNPTTKEKKIFENVKVIPGEMPKITNNDEDDELPF